MTASQQLIRDMRETLQQIRQERNEASSAKELRGLVRDLQRRVSEGQRMTTEDFCDQIEHIIERLEQLEQRENDALMNMTVAQDRVRRAGLQLLAGGFAGCIARTVVAPLDRIKLLMQTQGVIKGATQHNSVLEGLRNIARDEGTNALWKGNGINCLRVFPFAAMQFVTYDKTKAMLLNGSAQFKVSPDDFGIHHRLLCGSAAAIVATTATYPIDTARVQLTVHPELKTFRAALRSLTLEAGAVGLFKGYGTTMVSITPFTAVNFAAFDTLKTTVARWRPEHRGSPIVDLGLGALAGLIAQTCCYPLDLIRRRMQIKGRVYMGIGHAFRTIWRTEGVLGFYRGMAPNAMKVVPNSAVRFMVYDRLKSLLGVDKRGES